MTRFYRNIPTARATVVHQVVCSFASVPEELQAARGMFWMSVAGETVRVPISIATAEHCLRHQYIRQWQQRARGLVVSPPRLSSISNHSIDKTRRAIALKDLEQALAHSRVLALGLRELTQTPMRVVLYCSYLYC